MHIITYISNTARVRPELIFPNQIPCDVPKSQEQQLLSGLSAEARDISVPRSNPGDYLNSSVLDPDPMDSGVLVGQKVLIMLDVSGFL